MPAGVLICMPRPAYDRRQKALRLADGRCKHCTAPQHGGTRMCLRHRLYQAAWKRQQRARQAA